MFYLLNKYRNLQLLLSLPLLAWAAFTIFTQMTLCPPDGQMALFQSFCRFGVDNLLAVRIIAMMLLLLEILLVQRFYSVNKFAENRSFMPVFFLLLFLNVIKFFNTFTPAFFTMFALSFVMLVNTDFESHGKNRIFASGIIIGLASLLDVNALWLFPFLIFAMFMGNVYRPKDTFVLLSGILIVAIYLFSYHYLTDTLLALFGSYKELTFFKLIHSSASVRDQIVDWVTIGVVLLATIYFSAVLKLYFDNKLIVLRKRFLITVFLNLVMAVMVVFSSLELQQSFAYMLVPMVLIYSMISLVKKRRFFHDVLIVASIVLLWL